MVGLRSLCLDSSWVFAYLFFPLDNMLHENRHHDVSQESQVEVVPLFSSFCLFSHTSNCCPTPAQLQNSASMGVPKKESICTRTLVSSIDFTENLVGVYTDSTAIKSPLVFLVFVVPPQWLLVSPSSPPPTGGDS